MCTSSTVQSSAEPPKAGTIVPRFWRIGRSVRAEPLALPASLDNFTPHMRRDIGLENRPAMHWSDATTDIDRASRRP
jgi:hypothetical protein